MIDKNKIDAEISELSKMILESSHTEIDEILFKIAKILRMLNYKK